MLIALVAAGGLAATVGKPAPRARCGTVRLNEQVWLGSIANTVVAKAVLTKDLHCHVVITHAAPLAAFEALASGATDAVLEDWQNTAQYALYAHRRHTVVLGGPNGVVGHIGWYIPTYLLKTHPGFATWQGLKGHEQLFRTAESGAQGMFLGGDPAFAQKDLQLIQTLRLNLKLVTVGAEAAQVAVWSKLYRQRKPVLFYWYTPQYLNTEYDLTEVQLPPRFPGCLDDATAGGPIAKYRCAYGDTVLEKVFGAKFAASGSPAYAVLRRFRWSTVDQETVAKWIAAQHMDPDRAGQQWVAQNQEIVKTWLGT